MTSISIENGEWTLLAPINNIVFGVTECSEFTIDRITIFDVSKLSKIRQRLGLPFKISEFVKKYPDIDKNVFRKYKTFASLRHKGVGADVKEIFYKIVREELSLLSLSQLGYGRRRFNASPSIANESSSGHTIYLMVNNGTKHWSQGYEHEGKWDKIRIGKHWLGYQKKGFFIDLLNVIRGKIKVSDGWRQDLRNSAILAGQSQMSTDLPQAFLWNMIAIEMLLTKQGDHYLEKLPERAEAFLGWTIHWYMNSYEDKIREIYKKRCNLVHSGKRDEIKIEDLLFSDTLLLNVITNIVKHPKLFNSKEALIEYSTKIQAENILGIKSKNRPKTFECAIPVYSSDDLKKI